MSEARYHVGDVRERMAAIPDSSVDAIVTSPPFLALRSYLPADHPDKHLEIGSEATPAAFLTTLLALTAEWRRVLAPHGSLCVELGDTYSGSGGAGGNYSADGLRAGQPLADGSGRRQRAADVAAGILAPTKRPGPERRDSITGWPLDKSLCLLPSLYPASLAYGRNLLTGEPCEPWRVRNLIVWHRPNPPVGALGDKVRPSTSYVTVACTARNQWFDLDAERGAPSPNTHARTAKGVLSRPNDVKVSPDGNRASLDIVGETAGAPPLDCWIDNQDDEPDGDVWTIPTQPYAGAHYATFPIKLPRRLINLMCPRQVCDALVCNSCRHQHEHARTSQIWDFAMGREGLPITPAIQEELRRLRDVLRGPIALDVRSPMPIPTSNETSRQTDELQGRTDQPSWIHPSVDAGLPVGHDGEGLRPRAPLHHGAASKQAAQVLGACPPPERDQERQQVRESGSRNSEDASRASGVPALSRHLLNSLTCPACGHNGFSTCGEPRRRIVGRRDITCAETVTLGWSDCGHGDSWRRGVVLDPFAGSGTTLVAASELGRDSIGIDLDSRNLDLARQRIGMFLVEDEVTA